MGEVILTMVQENKAMKAEEAKEAVIEALEEEVEAKVKDLPNKATFL